MTSGYTAELGEKDKHSKNDIPCTERGWVCVPLVVEVFGGWGNEAQETLSRVAKKLAIRTSCFWPEVLASMYCRLGITLMRQNARALLGRRSTSEIDKAQYLVLYNVYIDLSSLNIMYGQIHINKYFCVSFIISQSTYYLHYYFNS